jgi:hypothetical protein
LRALFTHKKITKNYFATLPNFGYRFVRVVGATAFFIIKNRFFESPPMVGFQKTDFGVSSAFVTGNTKIGFIMRIAVGAKYYSNPK